MAFQLQKFSFKSLQKLNIADRLAAVREPRIGQELVSMLTPTQAALLFPAYYRRQMPDIGGFIQALPSSVSRAKQQEYESQLQNTTSGSASGANMAAGGWRKRYQQNMDNERTQVSRKGTVPLPQLSPEQKQNFEALKSSPLSSDDPRMKFLSGIDDSKLASVGITKYKEGGKDFYRYSAPTVSEEEAKKSIASSGGLKSMIDGAAARHGIDPRIMYGIVNGESGHGEIYDKKIDSVEESYGPFQMNKRGGLGNDFQRSSGLDVADSSTLQRQADWIAAEIAKRGGGDSARRWVASQWFGYGTQQLGSPGTRQNAGARAQLGDANWNSTWGTMGAGPSSSPTDYSQKSVQLAQERLIRQLEEKRIGSLAQFTQAQLPAPGSPQAQEMFSDGKSVDAVRKKVQSLTGMESSECVALAKAYVGATGSVTDWRRGNNVLDGNLQPGTPIATFMDRQGNPSTQYDGGQGRGAPGNYTTHAAVFMGYERDSAGKITGIRVMEQYRNSGGPKEKVYPANDSFGTSNAKNYYTINTSSGGPLGGVSPTQIAATAGQHEIRTAPPSTTPLDQFSRPILPEQKVQDTVPNITPPQQVAGPAAPTPAPAPEKTTAPTASVEAPKPKAPSAEKYNVDTTKFTAAIRQTEEFKSQAGMFGGMVPDSTIISGFNSDPRVVAAGVRLDEKGVMHFNKGMSEEAKSVMNGMNAKSFMTKIEEKKDTPTQVKPKADGGRTKVNTEEIAAYPIGGLRGDNAVVVNKQQQPLFTMNTNETAVMNPHNKTVDVIPNKKDGNIPPTQQDQAPMQNMVNEFHSAITELKNSFSENKAVPQKRIQEQPERDIDPNWITKLNQSTATPYRNPTAQRAMHRANGQETGDPTNGFHHSRGNIS